LQSERYLLHFLRNSFLYNGKEKCRREVKQVRLYKPKNQIVNVASVLHVWWKTKQSLYRFIYSNSQYQQVVITHTNNLGWVQPELWDVGGIWNAWWNLVHTSICPLHSGWKRPFSMCGRDRSWICRQGSTCSEQFVEGLRGRDVERTDSMGEFPCYFYKYRIYIIERLCGLVVRVPGSRSKGPGFDS
jgi:hypothetical protein